MGWLLLLSSLLLLQVALVMLRPRGWSHLMMGVTTIQFVIVCMVSAIVVPVMFGHVLIIRDEWQNRSSQPETISTTTEVTDKAQSQLSTVSEGLLPYRIGEGGTITTPGLHGPIAEWAGIDYGRPCGSELVAPMKMRVVGVGVDDGAGNTSIELQAVDDSSIRLGLVHGQYDVVAGEILEEGSVFGTTQSIGVSSGCHDHVVLWRDGVVSDISNSAPSQRVASSNGFGFAGGRSGNKPLIMSSYDPDAGGINCDSDCTTTASGEKVADWWGAGAACVRGWMGRTIEIEGRRWKCIDTGGKIVDRGDGVWVDLLTKSSNYAYGSMVYDWKFVE